MIIAIIVALFPPKWTGGTEVATQQLAEELAKRGHEVHIITTLDESLPSESNENGFFIHRLYRKNVRFIGGFAFCVNISRLMRRINPDIIQVQGLHNGLLAILPNLFLKLPFIIYGRGGDVYFQGVFRRFSNSLILKQASAVIVLTEDMKRCLQSIYDGDIAVIPNGINIEIEAKGQRKKEGVATKILFVGRFYPVKGTQYLLSAMKIVHSEIPSARLILVGDGIERKNLEYQVNNLGLRECVEFIGKVPHEKVSQYMNASDIFVLPSLSEGFPITVLEAMAFGLPIVATNVGELPHIVKNGVNGFIIEPKDPDDLADKLLILLKNDKKREEMSTQNMIKIREFSWGRVVDSLETIYQAGIN